MVHHKALAMDNLNSSSIILPRASSHLQHQPNRQHRRDNSLGAIIAWECADCLKMSCAM